MRIIGWGCLALALGWSLGGVPSLRAQDALRMSLASDEAALARQRQMENQPYNFRLGDLKILTGASVAGEWNDNVNLSHADPQSDYILKPLVTLTATYPITRRNYLRVNLGVGYDKYFEHDRYSSVRIESGSEIAFDMYIKDLWLNFHDRFKYIRDPAQEAGLANSARFGGFDNTAGVTGTLDLGDLVLTLGFDHQNFISSVSEYDYLNRASELVLSRAGFKINPTLTVGVEGTGSFTAYDQPVLNDNFSFSAGAYADWRPGDYFRVQPRAGYAAYFFDQTSRVLRAIDLNSWYADVTVTHDITRAISYSVSVGHEVRLGITADVIEATYVRPSVNWRIIKDLGVTTFLAYRSGTQGLARSAGNFQEDYDWLSTGANLSYGITRRLSTGLSFRYTLRSSDVTSRDYSQNLVALRLNYVLQ